MFKRRLHSQFTCREHIIPPPPQIFHNGHTKISNCKKPWLRAFNADGVGPCKATPHPTPTNDKRSLTMHESCTKIDKTSECATGEKRLLDVYISYVSIHHNIVCVYVCICMYVYVCGYVCVCVCVVWGFTYVTYFYHPFTDLLKFISIARYLQHWFHATIIWNSGARRCFVNVENCIYIYVEIYIYMSRKI